MRDKGTLQEGKFYSSRMLSQLLQTNESTIKRWADSGNLRCFKTPGGHRKFTPEHIAEFLRKYQYELPSIDFGLSSGFGEEVLNDLTKEKYLSLSEEFLSQALRADTKSLVLTLQSCHLAKIPLVEIYDDIIAKAVRKIVGLRMEGKLSEVEKHVASTSMFVSLTQFQLLTQKSIPTGKVAVCGSLTNGLQEVVLLGASHLLEVGGWKMYNLGSNTTHDVLVKGAEEYKPALICASTDYLAGLPDYVICRFTASRKAGQAGKNAGQLKYWRLKTAAESNSAVLIYFDFFTEADNTPEVSFPVNSTAIISSFRGLVPYIAKEYPSIIDAAKLRNS